MIDSSIKMKFHPENNQTETCSFKIFAHNSCSFFDTKYWLCLGLSVARRIAFVTTSIFSWNCYVIRCTDAERDLHLMYLHFIFQLENNPPLNLSHQLHEIECEYETPLHLQQLSIYSLNSFEKLTKSHWNF